MNEAATTGDPTTIAESTGKKCQDWTPASEKMIPESKTLQSKMDAPSVDQQQLAADDVSAAGFQQQQQVKMADDCCPPPPCCPPPDMKICCCRGPCGSTTITEKKTKCGCCRTIETVNKCGCTKNTILKTPCGCCKTFERRDKCGSCEKRLEKVTNCGCCRMNLCIGPCGCTKTTQTVTPTCCIKTHEAKSHCGCLNIRETKSKCGCIKYTECILPGGRCCRCMEERNPCGCKKCIENVNKCKCTLCKLQVCVGPQGCCKTQVCKNPCMCYRATEGHNKGGCCKVSEWKNKCGCLKVSERRNKCGFGCKTTICKTPCGCRKIIENITPCGCSTCIEGCNKCMDRGCCRVVQYLCKDCKTVVKPKCCDYNNEDNNNMKKEDNNKAAADAKVLYDVPQNAPGSSNKRRRFNCDACEFCGGPVDGKVAGKTKHRACEDDSFLYDVYARPERRSGGESQAFSVTDILARFKTAKLNPFSLSNSFSKLSVMKLKAEEMKGTEQEEFLLTGIASSQQHSSINVCKTCLDKGTNSDEPCHHYADMEQCAEGCCCFSCSPVPCAPGCCCPACCPAVIVPKCDANNNHKGATLLGDKKEKTRKHKHGKERKSNKSNNKVVSFG